MNIKPTDERVVETARSLGFAVCGLGDGKPRDYPRMAYLGLVHPEHSNQRERLTPFAVTIYRGQRPSVLRYDPDILVVIRRVPMDLELPVTGWRFDLGVVEYDQALALAVSTASYNGERVVLSARTGLTVIAEPSGVTID